MPYYTFQKEATGEVEEVFFHMNDEKAYNGANGTEIGLWKRCWTAPQASIDTAADPFSAKDFVKVTNKKGTIGDMFDRSEELHYKRKEKDGKDPVREKAYEKYEKTHRGIMHPEKKRDIGNQKLKDLGINVDWNR